MSTLLQDSKTQSDWITKAFAADKLKQDYTIYSFIEIDKFFNKHSKGGKTVKGGWFTQNLGSIIFSFVSPQVPTQDNPLSKVFLGLFGRPYPALWIDFVILRFQ